MLLLALILSWSLVRVYYENTITIPSKYIYINRVALALLQAISAPGYR